MTLITCKPGPESFYKVRAKIVDSLRGRRVIICHYHINHSSESSYLFDNFPYTDLPLGLRRIHRWLLACGQRPTDQQLDSQCLYKQFVGDGDLTALEHHLWRSTQNNYFRRLRFPRCPWFNPGERQLGVFFREVLSVEEDKVNRRSTMGTGFVCSENVSCHVRSLKMETVA